jgi:hypothetical protein
MAARRVEVQVAADEAELRDAAIQLRNAACQTDPGGLRQGTNAGEVFRVELRHAVNQIVGVLGPESARILIADVVPHPARPWRKKCKVDAALALHLELVALQALANLIISDGENALFADVMRIAIQGRLLCFTVSA